MLNITRKAAAAFIAVTVAAPALAEEHSIIIFNEAYYPAITYVQPGDTIIFENESDAEHTINGKNEAWTLGPVAAGSTITLAVEPDMQTGFTGESAVAEYIEGNLSFNPAPLSN